MDISLYLDEPLDPDFSEYLNAFFHSPHYEYDIRKIREMYSPEELMKLTYFGELGEGGEYFICRMKDLFSLKVCDSKTWPDIFCPWCFDDDSKTLICYGSVETRYEEIRAVRWLKCIIEKFLEPNGYFLNGYFQFDLGPERTVQRNVISPEL